MRTLTRTEAIADLRRELLKLVDRERSLCLVAARRGIFCNGFARWSESELAQRFPWISSREPWCTREELEGHANRWQLATQDVPAHRLPCDLEGGSSSLPCAGWGEFRESDLQQIYLEMCGEDVRVLPDTLPQADTKR